MSAVRKQFCCVISYGWRNTLAVLPWQPLKKSLCSSMQQVSSTGRQSYCITLSGELGIWSAVYCRRKGLAWITKGSKLVYFLICKSSGTLRCETGKQVPAFWRNVLSSSGSSSPKRYCLDCLTVFRKAALRMSCLSPTGYFSITSVFVMSPAFSHSIVVFRPCARKHSVSFIVRNHPGIVAEVLS